MKATKLDDETYRLGDEHGDFIDDVIFPIERVVPEAGQFERDEQRYQALVRKRENDKNRKERRR